MIGLNKCVLSFLLVEASLVEMYLKLLSIDVQSGQLSFTFPVGVRDNPPLFWCKRPFRC